MREMILSTKHLFYADPPPELFYGKEYWYQKWMRTKSTDDLAEFLARVHVQSCVPFSVGYLYNESEDTEAAAKRLCDGMVLSRDIELILGGNLSKISEYLRRKYNWTIPIDLRTI